MAGKTVIGGVAYDIKGGKTLIGGVAYDIKAGKTLVGGVGYDVKFGKEPFVIFQLGDTNVRSGAKLYSGSFGYTFKTSTGIVLKPVLDDETAEYTNAQIIIGAEPNARDGIDFTDYNTLHITAYQKAKRYSSNDIAAVGYALSRATSTTFNAQQTVPKDTPEELTFDISGISGDRFIKAYFNNANTSGTNYGLFITSIYLD